MVRHTSCSPPACLKPHDGETMYRPISDYAIIGDMHSAALVSSAGSIDWACLPHFDSPALFLKILDDSKGGYCSVEPGKVLSTTRRYLEGTNILQTEFKIATGVLLCTDFMPIRKRSEPHEYGQDVASDHRIIRLLQCTSGSVEFALTIKPTFSFATERALAVPAGDTAIVLKGKNDALHVDSRVRFVQEQDGLRASWTLQAGESIPLVLSYLKPGQRAARIDDAGVETCLKETQAYWGDWSKRCSYNGEHRDAVLRSALMLKLLNFEPTGAIVAAPTTSLPEEIGGVRNWDYRFTWVRDSTFTVYALMRLGFYEEAGRFVGWLEERCRELDPNGSLQPM